ncbi:2-hydroxyacyl-CoA dehydratase [Rhodococcus fascians]|nr:2-hydroxyacyl-CoA dehydratase [Rhodococcus fascians]
MDTTTVAPCVTDSAREKTVVLSGGHPNLGAVVRSVLAAGFLIGAVDDERGDLAYEIPVDESGDPFEALLTAHLRRVGANPRSPGRARIEHVHDRLDVADSRSIAHLRLRGDGPAEWDGAVLRRTLQTRAVAVVCAELSLQAGVDEVSQALSAHGASSPDTARTARSGETTRAPRLRQGSGGSPKRSRKSLECVADFGAFQKSWFASVRERAIGGEPFAVVNADAPQEILRAFDIPFVVNQWWSSIVAAKQRATEYRDALGSAGYPTVSDVYSSMGMGSALGDIEDPPWGGLPTPTIVEMVRTDDITAMLYESWSRETGALVIEFSRTVDSRVDLPIEWWEELPRNWENFLEPVRLDLMEAELELSVSTIAAHTGRDFSPERFVEIMDLVNEQEEYFRKARDLIAATRPAPAGIVDTMPATMIPQWHRGTRWGRDAARAFCEEVTRRVESGSAVCAQERIRLMWVGRGLWTSMNVYQAFEDSHGAVFVWSMYLALAADGYLRYVDEDQSPMRALAARFITMGDELRMPSWASAWHVEEAKRHGIDAAVAIDDADPSVIRALRAAGIPVLELTGDNMQSAIEEPIATRIGAFLDKEFGRA